MLNIFRRINEAMNPTLDRADLISSLTNLDAKYSYEENIKALGKILSWIRLPLKTEGSVSAEALQARNIRLKFLFQLLERHPIEAKLLADIIQKSISAGDAVGLYCMTGISENTGFLGELSNRMVKRILPDAHREKDLAEKISFIFTDPEDADWFGSCHQEIIKPFMMFSNTHGINFSSLLQDTETALAILSAQVTVLGTSREIRIRLTDQRLANSSFIFLNTALASIDGQTRIFPELANCRMALKQVRKNINETGVSVDLIIKLEKIDSILDRIEILLQLQKSSAEERVHLISIFMARLIKDELKTHGVKEYIKENLHLLTRKIVERAGERGEHYIVNSLADRNAILSAASWAGVLTAFTALVKYLVSAAALPLFFEGFLFFLNYAFGFIMIQKFHLSLSSKQPAYMASALSEKFEDFKKTRRLDELTLTLRKITISQLYSTFGNLLWVMPVTIILDLLWVMVSGQHIMDPEYAKENIVKHNPMQSLTIFYAALTGVLLWGSSVITGLVENWIVFRNVPAALRFSPFLNNLLGKIRVNSLADNLAKTTGEIAGNLAIAFLLVAPMVISRMTAIPLDVRHVTLATGSLTMSLCALEWNLSEWPMFITVLFSVLVIGTLNFTVSFYLAIRMAAMARNVDPKYLKVIFRFAFKKRRPGFPE